LSRIIKESINTLVRSFQTEKVKKIKLVEKKKKIKFINLIKKKSVKIIFLNLNYYNNLKFKKKKKKKNIVKYFLSKF
jgi:hypothetical protein